MDILPGTVADSLVKLGVNFGRVTPAVLKCHQPEVGIGIGMQGV